MAEPANEQLEEYEVPAGGIADFIASDEEIEAMDREDAERAFGSAGIANFQDVAARMAEYGRFGDDTVAHVQTGEIVIPAALIADNPTLKESIFDDLRARGIEDPERYVVGSPENSINPDTGLPEFFLKKLFKGVKKAFKKVGKFLKKASTVILPVALSFVLGPVAGPALGSGIATLINGGNIKDAFKAAAISGAAGGVLAGAGSVLKGGTFTGGVRSAVGLGGTGVAPSVPVTDAVPSVTGGELTAKGFQEAAAAKASGVASGLPPVTDALSAAAPQQSSGFFQIPGVQPAAGATAAAPPQSSGFFKIPGVQPVAGAGAAPGAVGAGAAAGAGALPQQSPGFFEALSQGNFREAFFPKTFTANDILTSRGVDPFAATVAERANAEAIAKSLSATAARRFVPLAAAGLGAAYGAGAFETPEPEPITIGYDYTGFDLLAANPEYYGLPGGYTPPTYTGPPNIPDMTAADGGEVYPRRNGGIMPDEGIPNEDSVRALLMPGEFVMTKDAVRGLGNGSVDRGIKNMYSVMRDLESRGRAS